MVTEVRPASAQGQGGMGCGSDSREQGNTFGVVLEVVEVTNGGNICQNLSNSTCKMGVFYCMELYQAPLSMGFSRQEYWSGFPFPPPGNLPTQGSKLHLSCLLQTGPLPLGHQGSPGKVNPLPPQGNVQQ